MSEENEFNLEKIINEENRKIESKYEEAEQLIQFMAPKKVYYETEIDYEVAKLMDLKRKKENQIRELKREIYDLDYEIGYKMGYEIGPYEKSIQICVYSIKE